MSMSCPSASAKTDPETVVNWPLLVTAAGLGFLLLAVPAVLACIAALKGDAVKDKVAVRAIQPAVRPANVAPVAAPARPIASYAALEESAAPLRVYVEVSRPPIKPVRLVKVAPVAAAPPPALDPVLQFPYPDPLPTATSKRRDFLTAESLSHDIQRQAKEVDLEAVKGTREKLLTKKRETASAPTPRARISKAESRRTPINVRSPSSIWTPVDVKSSSSILKFRLGRADLKGLPMLGASACQAQEETVYKREIIASELRRILNLRPASFSTGGPYRLKGLGDFLSEKDKWFEDDGISTVVQMLQTEDASTREKLVERLATVFSPKTSMILARLAIFDLSRNVRAQAANALKDRLPERYRSVLLEGLRYPWAPVAAHAAEALVTAEDREAAFSLAALLDEPDPCLPQRDKDNKWVVREMVSVNHLRNCLLCHAPSTAATDPLRGIVPTPGQPLPRIYYSSQEGNFVRADVTYLRQDFSLMQRVAKPDKWPEWQRFDYMVRTRELTADELAARAKRPPRSETPSYPQRNAVLFALRELTGLDAGEDSADWYEVLWATTP